MVALARATAGPPWRHAGQPTSGAAIKASGNHREREHAMDGLIILLIILLLVFGGGGFYTGRRGSGGGIGNILYVLAAIVLIVIVLRLLGIWV